MIMTIDGVERRIRGNFLIIDVNFVAAKLA
jgi:hypothetical protein